MRKELTRLFVKFTTQNAGQKYKLNNYESQCFDWQMLEIEYRAVMKFLINKRQNVILVLIKIASLKITRSYSQEMALSTHLTFIFSNKVDKWAEKDYFNSKTLFYNIT